MTRLLVAMLGCCCVACVSSNHRVDDPPDLAALRDARMSGVQIGVARVEHVPGVVIDVPQVEHVFYPGGWTDTDTEPRPQLRPAPAATTGTAGETKQGSKAAEPRLARAATVPSPISAELVIAAPSAREVQRAWRRHCKESAEMTSRDWEIVTTTQIPESIAKDWNKHCAEGS